MKKHLSIVLILFASLMHTISYASDDSNSGDKVFLIPQADTPPRVITAVPPRYPKELMIDGQISIEGRVHVKFIVTKDGGVRNPEVTKSVPEGVFDASALEAIKKYRFAPAAKDGKPVECYAVQPMTFSASEAKTSVEAYDANGKGLQYIKSGKYDKAVEAFTKAISISKMHSLSYAWRGIAYMNLKEYEKAITDFDTAIKINSPNPGMYYKLRGETYSAIKDYEKAVKDFDSAIELEPEMLEAYFERGNAFRNQNKYSEAIADYTKVIELDENFLQAYNNRAVAYNKIKNPEKMCLDIKKACDLGDCRGLELAKNAGKCSTDEAEN